LGRLLKQFGAVASHPATEFAWHRAIGLTSRLTEHVPHGEFLPDSRCFEFDYDDKSALDPDGCRLFRASFHRIQRLHRCIQGKLRASVAWTRTKLFADVVRMRRALVQSQENASSVSQDLVTMHDKGWNETMSKCAEKEWKCKVFDLLRRTDEIIKNVGFQDWARLKPGQSLASFIDRKIMATVATTPAGSDLEPEVVAAIRSDCFLVTEQAWEKLSEEARTLKQALPCMDAMWDSLEVAAAPERPLSNAAANWDEVRGYAVSFKSNFSEVPSVCARAAAMLVTEQTKLAPKGYGVVPIWNPRWSWCLRPDVFNCISFARCWEQALDRVCELNEACCNVESSRRRVR